MDTMGILFRWEVVILTFPGFIMRAAPLPSESSGAPVAVKRIPAMCEQAAQGVYDWHSARLLAAAAAKS
jgi:hypothetical protein